MGKSRKDRDISSSKSLSNEKREQVSVNKSEKEPPRKRKGRRNTRNNQKDEVE